MLKFINMLIAVLFLALSCYAGYNYIIDKRHSVESSKWPTSVATIISSHTDTGMRGGNVALYRPNVNYQFSVNGSLFGGSTISYPNPRDIDSKPIDSFTQLYQAGKRFNVSYNPLKPSENVLEPGDNTTLTHELFWGLGFFAASMLILFLNKEY